MKQLYFIAALAASLSLTATAATPTSSQTLLQRAATQKVDLGSMRSYTTAQPLQSKGERKAVSERKALNSIVKIQHFVNQPAQAQSRNEDGTIDLQFKVVLPEVNEKTRLDPPVILYMCDSEDAFEYGMADTSEWDGEGLIPAMQPVEAVGTYQIFVQMDYENATDIDLGSFVSYIEADIDADNNIVNIDLTKCTSKVDFTPLMANGEPFPTQLSDDDWPISVMTIDIAANDMLHGGIMAWGLGHWNLYMDPAMPEGSYAWYMVKYYDTQVADGSLAMRAINAPFNESTAVEVTADSYFNLNAKFALTPEEREAMGMSISQYTYAVHGYDYLEQGSASGNANFHPVSDVKIQLSLPVFDYDAVFTEMGHQIGTQAGEDSTWGMAYFKTSPLYVVPEAGQLMAVEPTVHAVRDSEGEFMGLSLLNQEPLFNIDVTGEDITYFGMTPYLSAYVLPDFVMDDEEAEVLDLMMMLSQNGPYFESGEVPDMFNTITKVIYNGEETDIAGIMGKPVWGSTFTFDIVYDGVYVCDAIPSSTEQLYTMKMDDIMDILPPRIFNYQIKHNGKITNVIPAGESCVMYVGYYDYNSWMDYTEGCEATIEIAAQNSDEWIKLPASNDNEGLIGYIMATPIDFAGLGLANDTWHKIRITMTDAVGNSNCTILNNAIIATDDFNGIATIESEDVIGVKYFDLQGREVSAPSAGIYVKGQMLNDGTMRYSKVAIR